MRGIFTTVTPAFERVSVDGTPRWILVQQARRLRCPSTRSRFPIPAPTVPTRPRHGHFLRRSSRGARRIPPGLRPPVPGGRESLPERPARRHGIHARLPGLGLGHRYTGPHHWCWRSSPRRRPTWVREPSSTPACWTGPCSLRRLRCAPARVVRRPFATASGGGGTGGQECIYADLVPVPLSTSPSGAGGLA